MGSGLGDLVNVGTFGLIDPNAAGEDAADAAMQGAQMSAQSQREALDYLKQQEKLPTELREASLKGLAGMFGLKGYENNAIDLTGIAQGSPIYQAMAGQIDQSLMDNQNMEGRNASAGGFLRSGVLADALAKQRARAGVSKAGALSDVYGRYLGGLQGLSNLPSNSGQIAQNTAGIGNTLGQGYIGAQQAIQQNQQNTMNTALGLGGLAFSDIRLKENVRYVGKMGEHNWYEWDWNDKAKQFGLDGEGGGVMAHEVERYAPEAIGECEGYMTVNYDTLRVLQ